MVGQQDGVVDMRTHNATETVCEVGGLIGWSPCKQDPRAMVVTHNNDKQWMTAVDLAYMTGV